MKQLTIGLALGLSLSLLTGASADTAAEREIARLRAELEVSNRHLDQIVRSLDRIDDAFSSGRLNVKNEP